jgi:paraquat-inducible protein B
MGKRANPTMVGVFVLGSFAIVIALIIGLGSSHLFTRKHKFVMFFSSDVNGLNIGAPVKFRGVEIGSVSNVLLSLSGLGASNLPEGAQVRIPVIIQLDSRKLFARRAELDLDDPKQILTAIQLGLRGELKTESLITGLCYIDLDMHPDTPARYYLGSNSPYQEIPTVPAPFEQAQTALIKILAALEKVNFGALATSVTQTANSINDLVRSRLVHQTIASFDRAAISVNATAQSIRNTSDALDQRFGPAAEDLRKTTAVARAALRQFQDTLVTVQTLVEPGSPVDYQLTQTLERAGDAARSLRQLADYLQRDPSSVIRGRYEGDGSQ